MTNKANKGTWLKALKILNLLKNKIGINIDFRYRLDSDDPDIFYITVDDEEISCHVKYGVFSDYIILSSVTSNIQIGIAEIMKVGKVSMLRLNKEHFLDDLDYAYRVYELNMELLESIK